MFTFQVCTGVNSPTEVPILRFTRPVQVFATSKPQSTVPRWTGPSPTATIRLARVDTTFEPHPAEAVQHLRGVVSDETSSFYPSSIVEVPFSRRGEFANPQQPAVVRDFDDAFSRLYGYVDKRQAEADRPLSLDKMLARIKSFAGENHWAKFTQEQIQLTTTVIRDYGFARAKVPLQINDTHPRAEYHGKSYLPCICAQVIDGTLDGPHRMYLLVLYIELPDTVRAIPSVT